MEILPIFDMASETPSQSTLVPIFHDQIGREHEDNHDCKYFCIHFNSLSDNQVLAANSALDKDMDKNANGRT
jgi:hypothetical protein